MRAAQRWLLWGVAVVCLSSLPWLASHVVYQGSASMPRGWYLGLPVHRPLTRGRLVFLDLPPAVQQMAVDRHYLPPRAVLLKPLAALPGEVLCWEGPTVTAPGTTVTRLPTDSQGRSLPAQPAGCQVLGPEEMAVLSTYHPRSWDSRYFGPLPVSAIRWEATPLWTWP